MRRIRKRFEELKAMDATQGDFWTNYQFTVKVKVCECLTPFEVPVIVKV